MLSALLSISKPPRLLPHRPWAIAAVAVGLVVLSPWATGCGGDNDNQAQSNMDPAFLTPVAAAEEAGLTVYWLGASFEAGGVLFSTREADFPEGIMGVPLQGLEVDYSSGDQPGGVLELDLLSRADWDQVKDSMMNPRLPGVERRTVSVAGRDGDLLSQYAGAGPRLNALWLVLDLGDVVVVTWANSAIGSAVQGSPELSPFIKNPDLLVQVMQDLRPYPQ